MSLLPKDFFSRKIKAAMLLMGLVLPAIVFVLPGCASAPSVFGGKKLVLEFEGAPISYDFPEGDEYCMTRGEDTEHPHRVYRRYDASTQEFYEMSEILNVNDGRGESHWRLDFTTPTTGKATLIRKHPWSFRSKNIGFSVPFKVVPLSDASVTIFVYPGGEMKKLNGATAESLLCELRELYRSAAERKLNESSMPTLSAEGAIIGHAQYDSPLVDIEDGEQSWTIARGLRESEALLLSYGTAPYRVPNQKKMLRLLNHIGLEN